jgi:thioredoxin-like negative regulator of GroEL
VGAVVLAVATVVGVGWRMGRGHFSRAQTTGHLVPAADVTLLQFSAPTCSPCRQVRVLCEALADAGVAQHVEIDVSAEPARAREFDVWRVPALFVVDGAGRPVWRTVGVPSRASVEAAVAQVRQEQVA